MGTSAAAGSVLPHQRLWQPDSALRALLLACRLELRHERLRASKASVRKIRSDCGWAPSGECVATVRSVGAVSVRACVRPRPSQNGPRSTMLMVSTYPEDRSRALKVHQEHQQVGRVAHQNSAHV
eukprot:scaffold64164_cov65-Phaeocystis_antarctica.AAC.1